MISSPSFLLHHDIYFSAFLGYLLAYSRSDREKLWPWPRGLSQHIQTSVTVLPYTDLPADFTASTVTINTSKLIRQPSDVSVHFAVLASNVTEKEDKIFQ